jgi:hypothetical protein
MGMGAAEEDVGAPGPEEGGDLVADLVDEGRVQIDEVTVEDGDRGALGGGHQCRDVQIHVDPGGGLAPPGITHQVDAHRRGDGGSADSHM